MGRSFTRSRFYNIAVFSGCQFLNPDTIGTPTPPIVKGCLMQLVQDKPQADAMQQASGSEPQKPVPKRRRITLRRVLVGLLLTAVVGILAMPTVISNTNLSTWVLNRSVDEGTTVTAKSFSIGWFSPIVANGVQIQKDGQDKPVEVEKLEVQKSFLDILRNKVKDATVTLTKPKFRIVLGDGGKSAGLLFPKMRTKVIDGQLTVIGKDSKEPVLKLEKLNFITDVKDIDGGRQSSMSPTTIIDHYKLTPEFTDQGLGLIAPLLASATDVDGSISVRIDSLKTNRIDGKSTIVELRGTATLHDVTSTAGPVASDLVDIMGYVLRREMPKRLTVTKDSVVKFELKKDRVYHEGFAFVLPEVSKDIELRSSGSVGLDESLDLKLALVVPESLAASVPVLGPLVGKPLEVKITGTLAEPTVGLPNNQRVADYIASRLVPTPDGNPEPLPAAIIRLVDGVADPASPPQGKVETLPGSIMNLIRSVREKRQQRIDAGEVPPRRLRPRRRRRGIGRG